MSLILSGSDGLSDVDGTAATPAIRGTDTNTGIFFPAADTIAFSEGGAESMRIDSAGNLGIGRTPAAGVRLDVENSGDVYAAFRKTSGVTLQLYGSSTDSWIYNVTNHPLILGTNNTERMRIAANGNVFVGATTNGVTDYTIGRSIVQNNNYANAVAYAINSTESAGTQYYLAFGRAGSTCGAISSNSTNSTTYATSSDYRLKENIEPMTGALDKVTALKPVTYKWKSDGSESQGFIAHELAEVFPDAVVGEKDGVQIVDDLDADGKVIGTKEVPRYQGIDTSFLVATLTAAIQELKATVDAQATRIAALENPPVES